MTEGNICVLVPRMCMFLTRRWMNSGGRAAGGGLWKRGLAAAPVLVLVLLRVGSKGDDVGHGKPRSRGVCNALVEVAVGSHMFFLNADCLHVLGLEPMFTRTVSCPARLRKSCRPAGHGRKGSGSKVCD